MSFKTIITTAGHAIIADAIANDTPVSLAEMAVGDGNGNPVTPTAGQTFLARERYREAINQLSVDPDDPTRYIAELVIPAIEGGFVVREVGLFDLNGTLFAVGNVPETYKPTAAEGAFSDTVVRMVFVVTNAAVVNLIIDPNVTIATRTWVINNVTASTVIPGGTTDQVLAKQSNADGDYEWRDPLSAVNIVVFSREETQTIAAGQTTFMLAELTTDGLAVYVEGVRLRDDQWAINSETELETFVEYPAGSKITFVQNEEVGESNTFLAKSQNLADVPDKAAARTNLELPTWLAAQNIAWARLSGVPAFASRWPAWSEVTDKPNVSLVGHAHAAGDITSGTFANARIAESNVTQFNNVIAPQWTNITGKPSTFTPASHLHVPSDITGLASFVQAMIDAALVNYLPKNNPTFTGTMTGPIYDKVP